MYKQSSPSFLRTILSVLRDRLGICIIVIFVSPLSQWSESNKYDASTGRAKWETVDGFILRGSPNTFQIQSTPYRRFCVKVIRNGILGETLG
jgi:hypothetical protein